MATGDRHQESIEWAAKYNVPITPGSSVSGGEAKGDARRDIIRYYAECQAKYGRRVTPDHFVMPTDCYIADSKAQAIEEYAPYVQYWYNTLYHFDHVTRDQIAKGYYSDQSTAYMQGRSKTAVANDTAYDATMTIEKIAAQAENAAWGTADEIVERVTRAAEHCGAETVIISCNRGAMPQEMFLRQIRRLGKEVLPRLQAHEVTRVTLAEGIAARPLLDGRGRIVRRIAPLAIGVRVGQHEQQPLTRSSHAGDDHPLPKGERGKKEEAGMKVFLFDLLPYGKHMDHLAQNGRLPWPFSPHVDPEIQVRTYAEHLDAWEEMERVGFDGISFNEHHGTPYGMMTSPNLHRRGDLAADQEDEASDSRQSVADP